MKTEYTKHEHIKMICDNWKSKRLNFHNNLTIDLHKIILNRLKKYQSLCFFFKASKANFFSASNPNEWNFLSWSKRIDVGVFVNWTSIPPVFHGGLTWITGGFVLNSFLELNANPENVVPKSIAATIGVSSILSWVWEVMRRVWES